MADSTKETFTDAGVHYEVGPLTAPTREALEDIVKIMGWPVEQIREVPNARD